MAGTVKSGGSVSGQASTEKKVEVVERRPLDSHARWGIEINAPGAAFDLSALRDKFTQVYFKTRQEDGLENIYYLDNRGVMVSANASRKKGEVTAIKLAQNDLDKETLTVGRRFAYEGGDLEGKTITGHTATVTEIVPIYYRSIGSGEIGAFTSGEKTNIVQDFAAQANGGLVQLVESRLEGQATVSAPHRHLLHMLRQSEDLSSVASELKDVSVELKGGEIHLKLDAGSNTAAKINQGSKTEEMVPGKGYPLKVGEQVSMTLGDRTLTVIFKGQIQVGKRGPGQQTTSRETSGGVLDRFIMYPEAGEFYDKSKIAEEGFIRRLASKMDYADSPLAAFIHGGKLILATRMTNAAFHGEREERTLYATIHAIDSDIGKAVVEHFRDISGFNSLPDGTRNATLGNGISSRLNPTGTLTRTRYEGAYIGLGRGGGTPYSFKVNGSFRCIVLNENEKIRGISQEERMPAGEFIRYLETQLENRKRAVDKTVANLYNQETDIRNVTYEGTKELGTYVAALVDYLSWFRDNKKDAEVVVGLSLGGGVTDYDQNVPIVGLTPSRPYRGSYVDLSTGEVKVEKRK